jgi:phosphatidylglycerol lysyltransferase
MLEIAEETVITPVGWSLQGKSMQDIRTAGNRASKAGIRAEWTRFHELPREQADQIREISEGWVSGKELPELGFTLGGLPELSDPAVALMLAVDTEDVVQAVTSWLPTYRNGDVVGWTLDVMRRRDDAMPGIMEFVISQTILRAGLDGIEFVSLSGAPLARTPGETETPASRILTLLGRTLEPSYGFGSLLRFKKKFRPELRPLYLAYPDPLALPAIGVAIARAYAPSMSMSQVLSLLR